MTMEQAMEKLNLLRKKRRALTKEIDILRQRLREGGGEHVAPNADQIERNKAIFKAWKDGKRITEIGVEYKLSLERVRGICKRIERILENKKYHFDKYKDLLPYNI